MGFVKEYSIVAVKMLRDVYIKEKLGVQEVAHCDFAYITAALVLNYIIHKNQKRLTR